MLRLLPSLVALCLTVSWASAQEPKKVERPTPTAADVSYGEHARQKFDFWQAKSEKPTPLVVLIHGGGWVNGDKSSYGTGSIQPFLDAGISVAAVNYRFIQHAMEEKVEPPVKAPLHDAARAIQVMRSKAKEWNLDKTRVGATGGSAGACTSLWLAFHDDLADPKSADPIARESTRLYCAAVSGAQVSLDPKELREWMPNYGYGAHAFGLAKFEELHAKRESVLQWIKEYSPIEHATKDDPPIFMEYPGQKISPVVGEKQVDPTHSAVMGLKLEEKLKSIGVEVILVYPGRTHPQYANSAAFLIDRLRK